MENRSKIPINCRLAVHTESQQRIVLQENKNIETSQKILTLTALIKLNQAYEAARKIKYCNIHKSCVFDCTRKFNFFPESLASVSSVSPSHIERFHSTLVLNRVTGAAFFYFSRTYENIAYEKFKDTAVAMGLRGVNLEFRSQISNLFFYPQNTIR